MALSQFTPKVRGDILIAKLSKDGTWLWAVSTGTATYYDECRGVTVDSNDDVYGTGYFNGSVDFNGTVITTTGFDGWVARVNNTGQFDWAMKFGGFDVDVGWDVVADNYDNLYVTGYYQNLTEFNASQLTITPNLVTEVFSLHITIVRLKDGIGQNIRLVTD